ncbi:MAG: ATP-binding cassette domain-containing protein [Acidimicrobiales bacterium]|nr:ATP-binding cassette domain-containing protein [Acidimicrobiales bacterium]
MARSELRSKIGMVLQDTWLFGGTTRDNIAYGNPNANDDQLVSAARATYVDHFVATLPEGYDSVINEEGDNISAGQKQLITIARAFLADPAILILDEATSSVDTRTQVQVQVAMNRLRANRTSFGIAHRLSTIRGADVILVMERGSIVEQGSHSQLLGQRGPTSASTTASSWRRWSTSSDAGDAGSYETTNESCSKMWPVARNPPTGKPLGRSRCV